MTSDLLSKHCVPCEGGTKPLEVGQDNNGYTIVELVTTREHEDDDDGLEPLWVHLAHNDAGVLRVIGLWRQ